MDALGSLFDYVLILLLLAVAIAAASITVTRARIFKPARDWMQEKNYLLFKLISCPYCLSHWYAMFLAYFVVFGVTGVWLVDWLLATFMLVGLSALLEGAMMNLLHMQESYIQELEDAQQALRRRMAAEHVHIREAGS